MAAHRTEERRVLSIQSHVTSGYVGNKCATFCLNLLGWEVDVINTVQFSNHTGYGRWGGSKFDAAHLKGIFESLDANGLLRQSHMLTGYTPSAESLDAIGNMVDRLREVNPELVYVLDTVCGDDNKLYVSPEVIPRYKELIRKATVITPNQFEAELFSDIKLNSLASVRHALRYFHDTYNLPNVLISSIILPKEDLTAFDFPDQVESDRFLVCAGSTRASGKDTAFVVIFPEYPEHYEGVGDTFSALTLANLDLSNTSHPISALAQTAESVLGSLSAVIRKTQAAARSVAPPGLSLVPSASESPEDRISRLRCMELRLIHCQDAIRQPEILYKAQKL